MFTGLIEAVCRVKSAHVTGGGVRLSIDLGKLALAGNKRGQADESKIGDSIAINGVCLTVAKLRGNLADFDVSGETLRKSALGRLKPGSEVNTELAMKASSRFGGHFVEGHIDGTATIKAIEKHGRFADIRFAASPELLEQMVAKGSVAVDGISLTTADINENGFTVVLIPETLEKTTLGKAKIGDVVNIETDIIAKIIKKQVDKILPSVEKLSVERLKELGF
jgi:riboflavin synthase